MNNETMNYINEMNLNGKTDKASIDEAEKRLEVSFPSDYKDFIIEHNGAEGAIGENAYLVIWSMEDIATLNEEYGVSDFTPELVYFGSDGGDMAYAFDKRKTPCSIVEFPFEALDVSEAVYISDSFNGFLKAIYNK